MLGLMTAAAKKRAGAAKKGKATKMRRIDYREPIMPKDAPTAERSESTGEIMAKLERCNALGLQVEIGSLPPPTATQASSSTSSTVQTAPAAPRPTGTAKARRAKKPPKKSMDEIMAEANAKAAADGLPPVYTVSREAIDIGRGEGLGL